MKVKSKVRRLPVQLEDEPYDEKQQNLMQTYTYNAFAVNPHVLDCDYYHFCGLDSGAVNAYQNEYMSQYYWADFFVRRRFLILYIIKGTLIVFDAGAFYIVEKAQLAKGGVACNCAMLQTEIKTEKILGILRFPRDCYMQRQNAEHKKLMEVEKKWLEEFLQERLLPQ